MKCQRGYIKRDGYHRRAYVRDDGTRVASTYVGPACVPDKGLPGKTPASRKVLPKPVEGNLSKFGYHNVKNLTAAQRHAALKKGVMAAGYATIIRRLNLIANYTKNSDPRAHGIYRSDMKWIQNNLSQYSKSANMCGYQHASMPAAKMVKAGKYTARDGQVRQLYRLAGHKAKFYRYLGSDGHMHRRYI